MKTSLLSKVVIAAMLTGMVSGVFADRVDDALRQLGRGASNVAFGAVEIPESVFDMQKNEGEVAAVSWGLARGVWRTGVREVVGVFEILTFPVRFKPVVRPEFPARSGVFDTVVDPTRLPDEAEIEDWEVDELEFNR